MHLVFDIFQGLGIAAAVGIRPYLPALAAGGLAAAHAQINFRGTDYAFLQRPVFLGLVALMAVLAVVADRIPANRRLGMLYDGVVGLALGALFFAGSLARGHYTVWPGIVGGVICAAIGIAATRPLLARVRGRLDQATAATLPLYTEAAALALAVLAVLAPPLGLVGLGLLVWLLLAGRRRDDQKYAGLRILR